MQKIIKIKAIGQCASIGSFYDATTNNFDSMSIFKSDISGLITTIDDPTTVYEFDRTNSFSEKFKKFDINGSLKLKLLAGLVELEGAGNYLKEDQSDNGSQKISLIYKCRTKKDSLNINDSGLINLFALDNFHNFTHFVTSIKWGADIVITFEEKKYQSNTNTNAGLLGRTEVSIDKIMKMHGIEVPFFDNIIGKIKSNGEVKFTGQDKKFDENLNVKINADIPGLDIIPTSMKELFEFVKNIHSKLENCNNGKGKPIEYELTPLCTIKQMFKLDSIQLSHFYNDLDNNLIDEIISDFDNYLNEKQKFNFFIDQCINFKDFLKIADFQEIGSKKKKLNRKEMSFKNTIFENLVAIRKAQNREEMNRLNDDFESNVEDFIKEANTIIEIDLRNEIENEIDFLLFLKNQLNVKLLGSKKSINHLLQTELLPFEKVFILLGQIEKRDSDDWGHSYRFFTKLIEKEKKKDTKEKKNEFYFADWNFHNDLVDEYFMRKSCIIIVYKNGTKGYLGRIQYENGDLYEGEMEKNGKMNGNGIKTWNCNGEVIQKYEGDWVDGKRNGFGKCSFEDGTRYEGEWKDDEFSGKGKFFHANSDVYEGYFKNGEAHGNGTVSNRVSEPNEHRLSEDVERVVQYHLKNSICDNSDDWKLIYTDKNNVQIYRRELIENGVVCDPIKAVFTIKGITGHELCQNFWNSSSSHEYGVIKKREVFFDLKSNDTFIVHQLLNKHWAAAQRDICFWSHIRNFDSNGISSWIAVNYSTEHEQAPIISPVIRAKINIALIGRTKLENNATKSSCSREDLTCEVTYVAFINPGGYVPVVILRKLFEKEYANFVSSFSNFVKEQTAGKDILF